MQLDNNVFSKEKAVEKTSTRGQVRNPHTSYRDILSRTIFSTDAKLRIMNNHLTNCFDYTFLCVNKIEWLQWKECSCEYTF